MKKKVLKVQLSKQGIPDSWSPDARMEVTTTVCGAELLRKENQTNRSRNRTKKERKGRSR